MNPRWLGFVYIPCSLHIFYFQRFGSYSDNDLGNSSTRGLSGKWTTRSGTVDGDVYKACLIVEIEFQSHHTLVIETRLVEYSNRHDHCI